MEIHLYNFKPKKDRASKIISYLGDIIVNGHPDITGRTNDVNLINAVTPYFEKNNSTTNYVEELKKPPKTNPKKKNNNKPA